MLPPTSPTASTRHDFHLDIDIAPPRVNPCPFDRLRNRGELDMDRVRNNALYAAGSRLREHAQHAALDGLARARLDGTPGSGPGSRCPITETVERHRHTLLLAKQSMQSHEWQIVIAVVIDEATLEQAGRSAGYGNKAGATAVALDRLRHGLAALVMAWRLLPPGEHPLSVA
ncbi:hypothetical protein M446_6965 (plasmid) [Methylobacterium sp. 4-46]|uniref:hypothetical protein n=1 Tax=unclassified Methylobacterium TaxID=2615210 RepID=UPI000152D3E9|nr:MULTISPECIES: hypothetical protein [Methylobacterium]ACA21198.1 hypothetical protein M446_6965 [Methylobacterium sp. 4-46]WFT83768.1 hypothetical protein QA634_35430 [Methylobacterium nodulans]